jgi:DNA-directed RNA polymerase subunit H (RpoH/RPB5)
MKNDQDFVIIVYWNSLTPDAKNVISKLQCIQTFSADELMFDLIQIVPKHTLLHYKPREFNKYPLLLASDPVRKYYNFKKNDVIQVEEDDGTIQLRRCN